MRLIRLEPKARNKVTIYLTDEQLEQLRNIVKTRKIYSKGYSVSKLIRDIVKNFLKEF